MRFEVPVYDGRGGDIDSTGRHVDVDFEVVVCEGCIIVDNGEEAGAGDIDAVDCRFRDGA